MTQTPPKIAALLTDKADVSKAYKALHVVPWLSPPARRVGAVLVDHFNRETGQCDPSIKRIARLLNLDAANVSRGLKLLCNGAPARNGKPAYPALFRRISHGGKFHRSQYLPQWHLFRALTDHYDESKKKRADPENGTSAETHYLPVQKRNADQCGNAPQYLPINPSKEVFLGEGAQDEVGNVGNSVTQIAPAKDEMPRRLLKEAENRKAVRTLTRGVVSKQPHAYAEVAALKANERIWADINRHCNGDADSLSVLIEAITDEINAEAARLEMRKSGAGFDYIIQSLVRGERKAG